MVLLAVVGCGDPAPELHKPVPEWQKANSASGRYVAEFPATPTTRTITPPGSELSMQLTEAQSDDIAFAVAETTLNDTNAYPLDEAVDKSIESARSGQESGSAGTVTATEISRSTGDFEGVETRKFTYNLFDEDKKATVTSLIFYRDNAIVQATVVANSEADSEIADRFLSSLKSRPA
jgi:hypothetical protein